jgi:hypothetical protein
MKINEQIDIEKELHRVQTLILELGQDMWMLTDAKNKTLPRDRTMTTVAMSEYYLQRYRFLLLRVQAILPASQPEPRRNNIYQLPVGRRPL